MKNCLFSLFITLALSTRMILNEGRASHGTDKTHSYTYPQAKLEIAVTTLVAEDDEQRYCLVCTEGKSSSGT